MERLRQAAAGQEPQSSWNSRADREAEAQEIRQQQQSYFDARTMAPTASVNDQSGWTPPYTWNHGNPVYMPATFTHPNYIGSRVPPAMTTQAPIAPEVFAAQRGTMPPAPNVSMPVAQTLREMNETMSFRTGDRDTQPRTTYGPPPAEGDTMAPAPTVHAPPIQNRLLLQEIQQVTASIQASMQRSEERRQAKGRGKGKGEAPPPERPP